MAYIHDKISPVTESLIIWNRLCLTGGDDKAETIGFLYSKNLLIKHNYGHSDCPLCERFLCKHCPWPGYTGGTQCVDASGYGRGLFAIWCHARTPKGKSRAALAIYELLRNIDDFPE